MYNSVQMFEFHKKKIKMMHLATGPEPVARVDRKSLSGYIFQKVKVIRVVPILCHIYNVYTQAKMKIMKFS